MSACGAFFGDTVKFDSTLLDFLSLVSVEEVEEDELCLMNWGVVRRDDLGR
jgi:hypothetical protein